MLFKLVNGAEKKHSHAGVLEFIAEEGRVYLPQWVNFIESVSIQSSLTKTRMYYFDDR